MPQVTVNSIWDGVTLALSFLFPDITIYDEEIPQDFERPSFFVKLLTMGQNKEIDRRFLRSHSFDIHYFPPLDEYNKHGHAMAESLYNDLLTIEIDGAIYRVTGATHEIVDRTLHFMFDLNFHVLKDKPEEIKMNQLEQEGRLKDDY